MKVMLLVCVVTMLTVAPIFARTTTRKLTSSADATSNTDLTAEALADLEFSQMVLQQSMRDLNLTSTMVSSKQSNTTLSLASDGKRLASLLNLVGADIAYLCYAAFTLSANVFALLTYVVDTTVDGVITVDAVYLTDFLALVAGIAAEIADVLGSAHALAADAKSGIAVLLETRTTD